MEGRNLVVSTSALPPYVILDIKDEKVILRGYLGEIWRILEKNLKFTSEYMIENYDDGVHHIKNKKRDVLLRPIVVDSDDKDHYDFTVPLITSWYHLYFKDSDEINSSHSYIRNWSVGLWASTAFMIVVFTVMLFIMLRISNRYLKNNNGVANFNFRVQIMEYFLSGDKKFHLATKWRREKINRDKKKSSGEESLGHCFITAMAALCTQGCHIQSHLVSIRILMLFLLLFGMIMCSSYSALLVSQLTLGERFLPFDTIDEMPEKASGYSLCVREESYAYLYFKVNETSDELQERWSQIVNTEPCKSPITHEIMCKSHVAILETPAVMNQLIHRNFDCKVSHLSKRYQSVWISVLILRGFDDRAKKEINKQIIKLRETGILKHLKNKWILQDEVVSPMEDSTQPVTYEHIAGVLMVYGSCIGVSCSFLIIENLIYIYRRWTNRGKQRRSFGA